MLGNDLGQGRGHLVRVWSRLHVGDGHARKKTGLAWDCPCASEAAAGAMRATWTCFCAKVKDQKACGGLAPAGL